MSVHAGAERNVCIIKVSAETPLLTTNPSQTLLPMYKLAHLPRSHPKTPTTFSSAFCADVLQMQVSGIVHWPKIDLKLVYIIYLHVCMRQYTSFFFHLSQVP